LLKETPHFTLHSFEDFLYSRGQVPTRLCFLGFMAFLSGTHRKVKSGFYCISELCASNTFIRSDIKNIKQRKCALLKPWLSPSLSSGSS